MPPESTGSGREIRVSGAYFDVLNAPSHRRAAGLAGRSGHSRGTAPTRRGRWWGGPMLLSQRLPQRCARGAFSSIGSGRKPNEVGLPEHASWALPAPQRVTLPSALDSFPAEWQVVAGAPWADNAHQRDTMSRTAPPGVAWRAARGRRTSAVADSLLLARLPAGRRSPRERQSCPGSRPGWGSVTADATRLRLRSREPLLLLSYRRLPQQPRRRCG